MPTDNELELDFELQFVKLYMDPKIRDLTAGHVSEWMFTTDITKAIIAATSNPAFENKLINPDTLVAFIEKTYKKHKFTLDEKIKIREIATEYKPVQDSEIGVYQFLITEFIKQRFIHRGIDLYLKSDKEAEKFLSLGVEFSFSNSEFIDPSNNDVILALKEASNPKGKIITSSISLINKSSSYGGYKYGDLVMVCLGGETQIKTLSGDKTLKELYDSKEKDFKVHSYNEKTNKIEICNAKEVKLMKYVTELLELEFDDGYKVKCTPDHKFLTKNRGWVEAKDLMEEDDLISI